MGYRLGIDLGTTFTAAATDAGGSPRLVGLGNRALQVPSVLYLREDGTFLCGEAAERRAADQPERVVREFKRRIGDTVPMLVAGQPWSPQGLTAKLLAWVVATATEREGEPPEEVVLTHPANWGGFKRELLGQVASLADLRHFSTCVEPEAAAIQYASHARLSNGDKVVVYDLGGGTFDVCVLRMTDDGCEILGSPDGVEHLGGIDFDEAVFRHVLDALGDQAAALEPTDPEVTAGLIRMRRDCVEAKEALSNDVDTVVPVHLPGISTSVRITRAELEALIAPAIGETLAATRRALRSAGTEAEDLVAVVLVGGSSRIPLISQRLQSELGVRTAMDTHPKHDIALGAVRHRRGGAHIGSAAALAPAASHAVPTVAGWPTRDAGAPPTLARPSATSTGPAPTPSGAAVDASLEAAQTRRLPTVTSPIGPPAPPTPTGPQRRELAPTPPEPRRAGVGARVPRWGWGVLGLVVATLLGAGVVLSQDDPPSGAQGGDQESAQEPAQEQPPDEVPGELRRQTPLAPEDLVVSQDDGDGLDLYVVRGTQVEPVFEVDEQERVIPAIDPTRRFLYYRQREADAQEDDFETRVADLETGTTTAMVDPAEERECVGRPTWRPGSSATVALLCLDGDDVYIFSGRQGEDGQISALQRFPEVEKKGWLNLTYSANGDLVAARGPKSSTYGLHVISGASDEILVAEAVDEPAVSPFDNRILYVAGGRLHLVHADGSEPLCPGGVLTVDPSGKTPVCRLTEVGEGIDEVPAWIPAVDGFSPRALFYRRSGLDDVSPQALVLDLAGGGEPEPLPARLGMLVGTPAWAHR